MRRLEPYFLNSGQQVFPSLEDSRLNLFSSSRTGPSDTLQNELQGLSLLQDPSIKIVLRQQHGKSHEKDWGGRT